MPPRNAAALLALLAGLVCVAPAAAQAPEAPWRPSSLDAEVAPLSDPPPEQPQTQILPVVSHFVPLDQASPAPAETEQAKTEPRFQRVWGVLGMRGFVFGDQIAPNGVEFHPFFTLDMNLNLWLWPTQGIYLYDDTRFWAEKPGAGQTNPSQGVFDFSKRELDFTGGLAWNYCGNWEARVFAYSVNNLNRGDSLSSPAGFNDGIGVENRLYLSEEYARLGQTGYDVDRASFISAGYYPTKDMIDSLGKEFKPSLFARAYIVYDLYKDWLYLYLDTQYLTEKPVTPKLLSFDGGLSLQPLTSLPTLEFRLGSEDTYDIQAKQWEATLYLGVRYGF